jgi:hypothetical protein
MTRRIHCAKCGFQAQHPEDVAAGWKRRIVHLYAHKPASHIRETHYIGGERDGQTEVENLASLECDLCGRPIADGENAVALTMWREDREPEPRAWESEYGTVTS